MADPAAPPRARTRVQGLDATSPPERKARRASHHAPMAMPWRGRDVPHAVVEVNQKCNISCTACYKDKWGSTKPLEQIAAEIEVAASSRRLAVVTLAGGEPTLHPQLPEVIRLVAARGLIPQLLSNGVTLTEERLAEYKACGLRRIYLHIDSLQRRPDVRGAARESDLDPLREEIGERVVRSGIRAALSLTLYKRKNFADLGAVVRFFLGSPHFDRFLVTCYTDLATITSRLHANGQATAPSPWAPEDLAGEEIGNREVARFLEDSLGMRPYAYVPSDRRLSEWRWLLFYAFTIHSPGAEPAVLHRGPDFQRVVRAANLISRTVRGTYPFEQHLGRRAAVALSLVSAAASLDLGVANDTLRFLRHLGRRDATILQKSLIFQQGPNVTEGGDLEICRDCPDATVREGRLVPLCLADVLAPVPRTGRSS